MRTAAEKLSSFFLSGKEVRADHACVHRDVDKKGLAGPGDRVVAAVSGGADSVCMLLLLDRIRSEIGFSLRALHVHHGIRGESADEDARFVSQLCERLGVRCDVIRVDVPAIAKERGTGIEETAREERYRALREACRAWEREEAGAQSDSGAQVSTTAQAGFYTQAGEGAKQESSAQMGRFCIAVAHHMEDQAETVLFRMARGSGLTGVAGMRPAAPLPGDPAILVIRPLLQFTRAEIEEIVTEAGTGWREDESNSDVSYARNRIRSGILPELAQINEAAVRHICALAEESAQAVEYLRSETDAALARCTAGESGPDSLVIDVKTLLQEHPLIADRVLMEALARAAGRRRDLTREHVEALRELCAKDGTAEGDFPGGVHALVSGGLLMFSRKQAAARTSAPKEASQSAAADASQPYEGNLQPAAADASQPVADNPQSAAAQESQPDAAADLHTEALLAVARARIGVTLPLDAADYQMEVFPYAGTGDDAPSDTYTKWLDYDKIQEFPALRTRRAGDRIGLSADGTQKKLSRCLIDAGIPEPLRDRIVFPCVGGDVLWIPGYRIHAAYKVSGETKRILCITLKESHTEC